MHKIGIVIQARMGSSRFPGKIMKLIDKKPMLHYVLKQVKNSKKADTVILATGIASDDDVIENFCNEHNHLVFRGSKDDLLDRYYQCAKKFSLDIIVRITSDCPLIDPLLIDKMIDYFSKNTLDYFSNNFEKINNCWQNSTCNYPQGMTVEICNFTTLEKAWKLATKPSEREHVFPYVQFHPELFQLDCIVNEQDLSHIRCTVDHPEDLIFVRKIYDLIPENMGFVTINDIKTIIEKNPDLVKINNFIDFEEGYKISLEKEKNLDK